MTVSLLARTATLVGEPARASMMMALLDGRALTAGELAEVAGISAQTASAHLAMLVAGDLLTVAKQGRHRYHRLSSQPVASMLESILAVGGASMPKAIRVGPRDAALRDARVCYDHLAGAVAVAIARSMEERGHLELSHEGAALTESGVEFLDRLEICLPVDKESGATRARRFCRPCLDWSERRMHIAGLVGAALLDHFLRNSWMKRSPGTRTVTITPKGDDGLRRHFNCARSTIS